MIGVIETSPGVWREMTQDELNEWAKKHKEELIAG